MHGPGGFDQALVSKGLLLTCVAFSLGAQLSNKVSLFNLDLPALGKGQIWRLVTQQIVWGSASELVLGSILLYTFRLFERHYGPRKYGACVLFLSAVSSAIQVAVLAIRGAAGSSASASSGVLSFAPGPYAILFGLLVCFCVDIPATSAFGVFGGRVVLSDKVFTYLLAAQMAFAGWARGSLFSALIGIVLGAIYRWEALPFHRMRIPAAMSSACGAVCRPVLSGRWINALLGGGAGAGGRPGRFVGGGHVLGRAPGAAAGAGAGAAAGPAGYAPVGADPSDDGMPRGEILAAPLGHDAFPGVDAPVDEAAVAQLTSMGFPEARARVALITARGNVAAATNILLGS